MSQKKARSGFSAAGLLVVQPHSPKRELNVKQNTTKSQVTRVDISDYVEELRQASSELRTVFVATGSADFQDLGEWLDDVRSVLSNAESRVTRTFEELERIDCENFRQSYAKEFAN